MELSIPRLVGSANAGTAPGSLNFEIEVRPARGKTYYLQRKYREFTAVQAELIRMNELEKPMLIPVSKSVGIESRRESAEELLKLVTRSRVADCVSVFLELESHGVKNGAVSSQSPAVERASQPARPPEPAAAATPRSPSAPLSSMEAVLEAAVTAGLTTPALAEKMASNVKSGKFTE